MEFFELSSPKFYITGMLMLFLSGCSLFQPFIDRRRNPGVSDINKLYTGPSKPDRPVICYNPLLTADKELQQMADDECVAEETGDYAELTGKKYFEGRLLLPARAYYKCVKQETQNPEGKEEDESVVGK